MRTKIYEYHNDRTTFSQFHVLDEAGRGCWELEIEIPDSFDIYEGPAGDLILTPQGGTQFTLNEMLVSNDGAPCIFWFDDRGEHSYRLKVLSRNEKSTAMYL